MDPSPKRSNAPVVSADSDPPPNDSDAVARTLGRLRVVLGLATLIMLGLSWPLWVEVEALPFPRVPFAPLLYEPPAAGSWIIFAVLLGSLAVATGGIAWRRCLGLSLLVLAFLILRDQHRFQAWAYQFGMIALLLAALPDVHALVLVRWWYIATYAYSGLSKLDTSFCHELGVGFLETGCRLMGVDCAAWPVAGRIVAILAMPVWEIAVALGLSLPTTRRLGQAGAVVLHVALIMILGPRGMRHSTIVLVWNAAMLVEVWIAFGPDLALRGEHGRREKVSALGWLVVGVFLIGVLLPLGEGFGYCDTWPAHALYASHVERTEVFLHEDLLGAYPPEVRRHTWAKGPGPWQRVDLTGWSRAVRGVPVYPQSRACNGLAEAMAAHYGDHHLIRVVQWGRADRWTGHRTRVALLGLEEIRRQGERYCLNAHPARGFGQAPGPGPEPVGAGPSRHSGRWLEERR